MGQRMGQRIESSVGLDQNQLDKIKALEEICNDYEGLTMKLNWEMLNNRPKNEVNDFLLYENDELVGYLGLYIFRDSEAEVSAMVHPKHRKQNKFRKLVSQARQELMVRDIPSFLFICEEKSISGKETMKALKTTYSFSEYGMTLKEAVPLTSSTAVTLRDAEEQDIEELIEMDVACFKLDREETAEQYRKVHNLPSRSLKVASLKGKTIGKISTYVSDKEAYIYGFCLQPAFRGKGHGKTILQETVESLIDQGYTKISLEVECKNKGALILYQRRGFEVTAGYDYYRHPLL
jgi:ribosomal protein S18 acetylase RimI-like enzyme